MEKLFENYIAFKQSLDTSKFNIISMLKTLTPTPSNMNRNISHFYTKREKRYLAFENDPKETISDVYFTYSPGKVKILKLDIDATWWENNYSVEIPIHLMKSFNEFSRIRDELIADFPRREYLKQVEMKEKKLSDLRKQLQELES